MLLRRERFVITESILSEADNTLRAAEEIGDPVRINTGRFSVGVANLWGGRYDIARTELTRVLGESDRTGDGHHTMLCLAYLSVLERQANNIEAAERHAQTALVETERQNAPVYSGVANAVLAWCAWKRGDIDSARALTPPAVEQLNARVPAYSLRWLGESVRLALAVSDGDAEEASRAATSMLEEDQQPPPRELHDALTRAVEAARAGDQGKALELFEESIELHRAADRL